MGLSSWAVALCFLASLHSHPLSNLVKFVGNHEILFNDIPAASGDFPHAITEISKFSAVLNSLAIDGSSTGAVIRGVKDLIVQEQYNPSYKLLLCFKRFVIILHALIKMVNSFGGLSCKKEYDLKIRLS
ncbi:hypothetical protein DAPPUDRAFT_337314 [Daphnia pulex]|uniref:Ribophorin-2 n=1 Tax=Daphnia pulex TaxID=6669 RepID=E9I1E5_DAPPU|nr:hypothetical protein DAPPUDRAFT_337314 [Daphnia pulex]|eukprot:EFX62185.1 hypothetical protein DAPPUDRAFT_337314 [Daphnia pulex]